jgi:hypothetical protein
MKINLTEQELKEYVRNAVLESLNEAGINEGWWDKVGAMGKNITGGLKGVGKSITGAPTGPSYVPIDANAYSQQKDVYRSAVKSNKNVEKAKRDFKIVWDKNIAPLLIKYGLKNAAVRGANMMMSQIEKEFNSRMVSANDPAASPPRQQHIFPPVIQTA